MHDPLAEWDYDLPADRIALRPLHCRDASRLLHLPRGGGEAKHGRFTDILGFLREGDLLVVNDSRVMAARLRARRETGGAVEVLLLGPGPGPVPALARPARRLSVGEELELVQGGVVTILSRPDDSGILTVRTDPEPEIVMARQGELPLPPYMHRAADAADSERYQTIFAGELGSAAAPTAGLHFTDDLVERLGAAGVGIARLTLHVGVGTFRPLDAADLARGRLHVEPITVSDATARAVARAKAAGGRVIAVGTTATRTLESMADPHGRLHAGTTTTDLFIQPGYRFRVIDGLITNFHLPRSSLLMLVAVLVDRERLFATYEDAVERGYRFYSYGDAMLLL